MRGIFGAIADTIGRKDAQVLDRLPGFMMNVESRSGITVTYATALQVSVVLACVKVVGEGLAQSPCRLMRPKRNGKGAEPAYDHPVFRRINLNPMGKQTAFEFWETVAAHIMLCGNAFAYINRVRGEVRELILLEPGKVEVTQMQDMSLRYFVSGSDGTRRAIPDAEMWHMRGLSWNGWMGLEVVKLAREAIGLSIALERSHAEMHKNGAKVSGTYSIEGKLTPEQHKDLTSWLKSYATSDQSAPLILDRGAKWFQTQLTGVDAQHLETRRFQIEEVCRALRVNPIMVMQSEKTAAYASSEQMFLAHVIHTLLPWAVRLEQSAALNLLSESEIADGYQIKFALSALMRGDYKSRQEGLQILRRNGIINANEWRALEDMNPRDDPGGDQYIVEANMAVQEGGPLTPPKPTSAAA